MRESDREQAAAEQQAAADFLDLANDAAGLWQACTTKACRRMRACIGDADACGARRIPEAWAWVHGALRALRDGVPLRAAMRGADRQVIALETDEAFGARPRKVMVHYPGLGESFEMTLLPEYMKGRRRVPAARPSAGPARHRPLAPTHGVGHSRGRANQAIPRRS